MYLKRIICYKIFIAAGLWVAGCGMAQASCRQDPDSLLELLLASSAQEYIPSGSAQEQPLEGDWSRLSSQLQSRLQLGSALLERSVPLRPQGPLAAEALEDLRYLEHSCKRARNWSASHPVRPAGYLLQLDWQLQALSAQIGALGAGMKLPGRGTLADSWSLLAAWLGELRETRQHWEHWLQQYVSATRSAPLPVL